MLLGVPHLLLAVGGRQLNPAVNEDRGCPSVAPHRCPCPVLVGKAPRPARAALKEAPSDQLRISLYYLNPLCTTTKK